MNNEAMQAGGVESSSRKKYEPPQLVTINLRPEEAVLGHCKISASAGPVTSTCVALSCMTVGS
jgi:hypothetical protein